MGEARRRGSFEERKDKAIEEGYSKEMVRRMRLRLHPRRAGKVAVSKALWMAMMLTGKGVN